MEKRTIWERHAQSAVAAASLALLFWVFTATQEQSVKIAEILVRVHGLEQTVTISIADNYRSRDAEKDLAVRDDRLNSLSTRISVLEAQARTRKE